MNRDAVVVGAVRTPVGIGKPGKGLLSSVHPVDLSGHVIRQLLERTGVEGREIEDVVWGCVSQVGEQALNVGRNAALAANLPESVVGTTVDRQCGSSQQAVQFVAAGVVAGHYDVAIAGGVESMSRVVMFSNLNGADPFGSVNDRYNHGLVNQGISAERIAAIWKLSRGYLDELAVRSHERAAAAAAQGSFADEIVPVETPDGVVKEDQGIRPGTTVERLSSLPAPFLEGGVITAGNASQISDGAAALLIMTSEKAAQLGLRPLARLHSFATTGVDPIIMLTAVIPATAKVLTRPRVPVRE